MKTVWMTGAVVCVVMAIVFLLRSQFEVAFVLAAIGSVAWFLNYRVQIKEVIGDDNAEEDNEEEDFESDEER